MLGPTPPFEARRSWPTRHGPALGLWLAVVLLALPMFTAGGRWGGGDWDYFSSQYEAMRRSVVEYRQVPWWNPWSCGGMPLAANPQLGLLSLDFLCVLVVGTVAGLKVSVVLHLLLAAEGARRLAGEWLRDPLPCAVVGLVFVANGAVAQYVAAGHLGVELIAWAPWALLCAFRMERDGRWGLALGLVLALEALTSFQYFTVYLMLVLAGILAWRCWAGDRKARHRLVLATLNAACVFLAFAGLRTVLAAELVLDSPRGGHTHIEQRVGPGMLLAMLLLPGQRAGFEPPDWFGWQPVGWHEFGCYVGLVPCAMFLVSLKGGWRWWHSLAVAALWFAVGNSEWYHPSWWLTKLPVLNTLRVATRWRVIGILGIALGCGAMLAEWRASRRAWVRWASVGLALCIAIDLVVNALPVYSQTFVVAPEVIKRSARDTGFVQLHNASDTGTEKSWLLPLVRANYGIVYGYEPVMGQDAQPLSGRLWRGHPDYQGEFWSSAGPVRVVRWSPNRISLAAPPRAEVHVNQNPGSYWLVNGGRSFTEMRSVDRHADFTTVADAEGRVELSLSPWSLPLGVALSLMGFVGVLLACVVQKKLRRGQAQHQQDVAT